MTRSARSVYTNFQGTAKGFTSQLRTQHNVRQLLGNVGPSQRALVPFVRARSWTGSLPQRVRQLQFGPNRFSSLQLPAPIQRHVAQFSPLRLQLKQRTVDFFAWCRKNLLLLGSTAATVALFGVSIDVTSKDYEYLRIRDNASQGNDADGPHWWEAGKAWSSIVNGTFLYDPMVISEEKRRQLQADIFGKKPSPTDESYGDYYDEQLNEAYRHNVINIYDLTLSQKLRKAALMKIRARNQLTREIDSMSIAYLKYGQRSLLHKKALERAELFYGVLMYSQDAMLPSEEFMDTLLKNVVAGGSLETFINEVDEYVNLVFLQVQDGWTPDMKQLLAQTAEEMNGRFSSQDVKSFMKKTDPDAKKIFTLVLRKKGSDHVHSYNTMLDYILSAEAERVYWEEQYGAHRLLFENQPIEVPTRHHNYLQTLFWYQLYLAEPGKKELMNKFVRAMSRLSLIRLYSENRAVGMSVENLEDQISSVDLEVLKTSGLPGIAKMPVQDTTTFTDYTTLAELAGYNETFLEYTPTADDYVDDVDNLLNNELAGVNDVRLNEDVLKGRRRRRDVYHQQQLHILAKRNADNILKNLTMDEGVKKDLELFNSDPGRSILFQKRINMAQRPLTLMDLLQLQEELRAESQGRGTSLTALKDAHHRFLVTALQFAEENKLPGEILAMLLEPEHGQELPLTTKTRLQAARRVLKIKPLQSLIEKRALLDFLLSLNLKEKMKQATLLYQRGLYALLVLSLVVHIFFFLREGLVQYRKYRPVLSDAPSAPFEQ